MIDIKNIEMLILLFFSYSFLGWFMESVGGILKVKRFVNRGFLIGPYCPVYGVGVLLITVLLNKYINDIPALFIMSVVICGSLEYATSFIMEKLFNARWWDYHNKRFNINGRVCLETLIPFGIAGSIIVAFINPFLIGIYEQLTPSVLHLITGILCVAIFVDFIVSFRIILSFRGETYKSKDNTEEISEMVKEKAEDVLMKTESDIILFGRKLKIRRKQFKRNVKFTRKHLYNSPKELQRVIDIKREEFLSKISESKQKIDSKLILKQTELEMKQKERKEVLNSTINKQKVKIEDKMTNIKKMSEEIIEEFKSKSMLRARLMNAFPSLEVKEKTKKK